MVDGWWRTTRSALPAAVWLAAAVGLAAIVSRAAAAEPLAVDFATSVLPIFAEHCFQCHGPDKQESGLRLDQREAALKGGDGGPLLVVGKSNESELARRIRSTDDDERMPPSGAQTKPLSEAEVATIVGWIDAGAHWPQGPAKSSHWSFQPVVRPALPAVRDEAWPRNAIDRFVLARLESRGLSPAPEADRYTLAKRLAYDLIGLPLEPEEVDAFVEDTSSGAYERLVERLLESPHFGERWGRHWLDLARYADSDGYEKDNPRPDAWRYRDWVIEAINADMPLDRFAIEQLAGDLVERAGPSQRLATAFHRQTLTNTEGGTDQEQFRVEAIFDRIATTGTVWLGLTVGCAQCHSHKYDPISHDEYYRLFAFFNNGDEVESEIPLAGAPLDRWNAERSDAEHKLAELAPKLEKRRADVLAKLPAWEAELRTKPEKPLAFHPVELVKVESSAGTVFKQLSDGSLLAAENNPDVDRITITAKTDLNGLSGFQLEALADDSLGGRGPGRTEHGNFVLSEFHASAASGPDFKPSDRLSIAQAAAEFAQNDFPAEAAIDGKETTGWAIGPQTGRDHAIRFVLKEPLDGRQKPWLQLVLSQSHGQQHTLGRFRLMATTGYDPLLGVPKNIREIVAAPAAERSPEQMTAVAEYFVARDKKTAELAEQVRKLKERLTARPVMKVRTIAQRTSEPRKSHRLRRGDFLQPEDVVAPGTLAVLPPLAPRAAGTADRLDLARWLVDPANPLPRRVLANRLWGNLLAHPLVRTPGDFGVRGQPPTHPELLDWLADELAARGWSRKEMIRLIVTSATYRQSSAERSDVGQADPLNELLHRQNRFRVEGEIVRDLALAASGLLSDKVGGPSVFPPLPADIAALSYAGNFKWKTSSGADRYRRGMYTFFKRTAPHPNLTTFDCPDSNITCAQRQVSNTPLQALTTMNNEVFAEAARAMAARLLGEGAVDDRERLQRGLRLCIARPPTDAELAAFGELLAAGRQWYATHADEAKTAAGPAPASGATVEEVAAWTATARIMLNLDEFLTRE